MSLTESIVPLNTLTEGERGEIISFEGGSFFRKKLEEMGLRIGTTITIVARQWMKGPVIVRFENTEVAIGFNMAKRIMVKRV